VIVAGGDGTLAGVANGLVHNPVPLGIIPLGTGNDLARALLIPLKIDEAVELLAGDHAVIGWMRSRWVSAVTSRMSAWNESGDDGWHVFVEQEALRAVSPIFLR